MADSSDLSDGAYAVFAFAAYHQLQSGQPVTSVVADDGHGHKADEAGVGELSERGLASRQGNDIVLSEAGLGILAKVVDGIRSAVAAGR